MSIVKTNECKIEKLLESQENTGNNKIFRQNFDE